MPQVSVKGVWITVKKHFGIALVTALLMLLTFALCASAAGTATVVYLSGSGSSTADGLTPETAVNSINTAYNRLDPNKDGTVVVCGEFTQSGHFARAHSAKSITLTSVYGGVDYRESGAIYKVNGNRFALADDTTFENITFETAGGSFLVIAQHHAVTVGEGVAMNNFDGTKEGEAFWIVGSVQWKYAGAANNGGAVYKDRTDPVNITVLSGSDFIVVGGPRDFSTANGVKAANACTYGDIHIRIGGEAQVNKLYATGYASAYTTVGDVSLEVFGDATVGDIVGAYTHNVTASDFRLLWTGGNVGSFVMKPDGKVGLTSTGSVTLEATEDVRSAESYAAIAASGFTAEETHTHDFDYENGTVLEPATCMEPGIALYPCKTCSATEMDTLAATGHTFGDWEIVTPADFGTTGEKKRTCIHCDALETETIPAVTAKLEKISITAATDTEGVGAVRLIAKLSTTADATVTDYGIFVAKTDAIGTAKVAAFTATAGNETTFALDLAEIPHGELDTAIYAWAFANVDGEQVALPLLVGVSVSGILSEMGV